MCCIYSVVSTQLILAAPFRTVIKLKLRYDEKEGEGRRKRKEERRVGGRERT